jgi:hypothetical protein
MCGGEVEPVDDDVRGLSEFGFDHDGVAMHDPEGNEFDIN